MQYKILTKRGYELLDVASVLQKSIRRGDTKKAGYFAQELVASNYHNYVWKRLLTISAEDCAGIITQEIQALHNGFTFVNKGNQKKLKGRIFISKAVIILCHAMKSRDADHLQCLLYDKNIGITDQEIEQEIAQIDRDPKMEIPEYTYDCHTKKGKFAGKTKQQFFIDEQDALYPKQQGLFDDLVEKIK